MVGQLLCLPYHMLRPCARPISYYVFKLFGHQWMGKVRVLILEMAAWNVYVQFWSCNHDRTGHSLVPRPSVNAEGGH